MTIYVRMMMGLGNQMFQYAAGWSLARHLDTELVVDLAMYTDATGNPSGNRDYELTDIFGITTRTATPRERSMFSYSQPVRRAWNKLVFRRNPLISGLPYEQPWLVNLSYQLFNALNPAYRRPTYFEPHFHFDRNFFKAGDNRYIIGYWQSWRYFEHFDSEIHELFTIRPDLTARVQDLGFRLASTNSIGIHIRRTDKASEPRYVNIFGSLGRDYYRSALNRLFREDEQPSVYVFTDEPESARHVIPEEFNAILVSDVLSNSPAQDLYLMSKCQHLIIANSSFSWWAAKLKDPTRQGSVIAPRHWYATRRYSTRDLYPPEWLIID